MKAFLRVSVTCAVLLTGVGAGASSIVLSDIDSGLTSPAGNYRWLNVADQPYSDAYRASYNYTQASVQVDYEPVGTAFRGALSATNLKPNFAYQLKLVGASGTAANERIGLAGRWWQEEWDCATSSWVNGWNLNDKGDGSSPSPNDLVYFSRRDVPDAASPTGLHYKYTGYLVFEYFITDDDGNATLDFTADSSYHVLWKTSQLAPTASDGPVKTASFDPVASNPAYGVDWPAATVSLFGEWERLPVGGVFPGDGIYACDIILTEESFHGSGGTYAGGWAAAMGAVIGFTVTRPGDANGDGKINGADLALWQQHYDPLGSNPANSFAMGDWNGDGKINGADLALWQQNYDPLGSSTWGASMGPADVLVPVPEPATLACVFLGAVLLSARARRRAARRAGRTARGGCSRAPAPR